MTREEQILSLNNQVEIHVAYALQKYNFTRDEDIEDLRSFLWIAAIKSVDKFDSTRGNLLITYTDRRLKGAAIDFLRSIDYLTKSQRKRVKNMQENFGIVQLKEAHSQVCADPRADRPIAYIMESDRFYKLFAVTQLTTKQTRVVAHVLHGNPTNNMPGMSPITAQQHRYQAIVRFRTAAVLHNL